MNETQNILDFYTCKPIYKYCVKCKNKAWIIKDHDFHDIDKRNFGYIDIEGIFVKENVIKCDEEKELVHLIDSKRQWTPSQEGRAKQDYGPKVNFQQQKASIGHFEGFPQFVYRLFRRLQESSPEELDNFVPVEFCFLEYTPERGSYIRPHYDDFWIWGDRLVTVNLLSETYLTLNKEYNTPPFEIKIALPPRSLLILKGEARYNWHHSINRMDIKSRRIAMTWREFGRPILEDANFASFIKDTFEIAQRVIL